MLQLQQKVGPDKSASVWQRTPRRSVLALRAPHERVSGWSSTPLRSVIRALSLALPCFIGEGVTVLEVIKRSADFLAGKGIESPRLQVECLLADLLKLPRLELYLNFERQLSEGELAEIRSRVVRRGKREPLQHIVGSVSFCGIELAAGPGALVPRPETEQLAELGWKFLNELGQDGSAPLALDFGAGTGCLALALAKNSPARIVALEKAPEALALARRNVAAHQLDQRIELVAGETFQALPCSVRFDLVISNPPYIATGEIDHLEPEVRDHDPRSALDGGLDGLEFFRYFAREAAPWLAPRGKLMAEFGDGQAGLVEAIFTAAHWNVEAIRADLSGRPRMVIALPKIS